MIPVADSPTLQFLGAAGTVTGSKHLLTLGKRKVLLDCGLFQGLKALRLRNWARLPFDTASLDAVLLSHAHIDHSGALPLLVKQGFRGKVFCTPGTRDLLRVMLPDAAHLQEEEAGYANRKGYSKHHPALPLYTRQDAEAVFPLLESRPYGKPFPVAEGIGGLFRRAGHILGSATVELRLDGPPPLTLAYSGDLGRWDQPILRDPDPIPEADVLLVESTYGSRTHALKPEEELARIVREAAERGGALLIPAFAVGRTQTLIWMLHELAEAGRIPKLPSFLDSPMANRISEITCRHEEDHDDEMRQRMEQGRCPICTRAFAFLETPQESKSLNRREGPFIVIAGSGMVTGGRILHHMEQRLPDSKTTLLFTGFQAAGTRGRSLQEGAPHLKMHGRWIPVKAKVEVLDGLSAHADQGESLRWLSGFRKPPRQTYVVHGEPEAAETLADVIRTSLGWRVTVAGDGEQVELG